MASGGGAGALPVQGGAGPSGDMSAEQQKRQQQQQQREAYEEAKQTLLHNALDQNALARLLLAISCLMPASLLHSWNFLSLQI